MDRFGRVPVLAAGFATGGLGGALAALGSALESAPAVLAGLVCVGAASGTALLARTAAGDMYPPERRARGIALVLFGAVFGAILGPLVFSPLLAGRELDGDSLALLWWPPAASWPSRSRSCCACAPTRSGSASCCTPRAERGAPSRTAAARCARSSAARACSPRWWPAQASFAVMVGIMTLTGSVVVDHHHHAGHSVFPIIGAHVFGMYALVLVIGDADRPHRPQAGARRRPAGDGRRPRSACCGSRACLATAVSLFGLGIGWNLSFVAATATLADCAAPWERGKLLGFNDLLAGMTGAALALAGGLALSAIGVAALAIGGAALVHRARRVDRARARCRAAALAADEAAL